MSEAKRVSGSDELEKEIENALLCGHSNVSLLKGKVDVHLKHWEIDRWRLTRKEQESLASKNAKDILRILTE